MSSDLLADGASVDFELHDASSKVASNVAMQKGRGLTLAPSEELCPYRRLCTALPVLTSTFVSPFRATV
jgi:hypothetical protein